MSEKLALKVDREKLRHVMFDAYQIRTGEPLRPVGIDAAVDALLLFLQDDIREIDEGPFVMTKYVSHDNLPFQRMLRPGDEVASLKPVNKG